MHACVRVRMCVFSPFLVAVLMFLRVSVSPHCRAARQIIQAIPVVLDMVVLLLFVMVMFAAFGMSSECISCSISIFVPNKQHQKL